MAPGWCIWPRRCLRSTALRFVASTALRFVASAALLLGATAALFAWLTFSPFPKPVPLLGCRPDDEGSWSIGVFYGRSPLSLEPIESWDVWRNESEAWPVANPVVTCASVSNDGFPSNFVADPFLYVQGDVLYLFYETKNSVTLQGDIGVAMSKDQGATWHHLGIALDEEWHLSYPYIFSYQDQIYMMPQSSKRRDLRLYSAVDFPLRWKLEEVILMKPLVDSFIINYQGSFWLFGSDFNALSAQKNVELEIWYSASPLGPWLPHKQNPVHNMDKSSGARNAGRPFIYNGELYRVGQDYGNTYGQRVRLFKVNVLNKDKYEEVEFPLDIGEPRKGRNAWNGARYHHLDVQQLASDHWIAVMDGDRVPSEDVAHRLVIGYTAFGAAIALIVLAGVLLNMIKCTMPLSCYVLSRKRSHLSGVQEFHFQLQSKFRWLFSSLNKLTSALIERIKPNTCAGRSVLAVIFLAVVILTCIGTHYVYGGNGAEEPYLVKGHYSQFTLLTMTYDARLWNLKMYVKHYSRCTSVREIMVVWNKGQPPNVSEFDSTVPIKIRVENMNSLNNRFNIDPSIKTRAVLELDDDIMMTCDDVERGFKVWRDQPDRIVGFYPRLADGRPLRYQNERYARERGGYNMILTGAAFMDHKLAFERYWNEEAKIGRDIVDKYFNCEDVLLNFLYVNASTSRRTVDYVKPSWAIDTSKFSGVAISKDTQAHYNVRSECVAKFTELYGDLAANKWSFGSREDGWDV